MNYITIKLIKCAGEFKLNITDCDEVLLFDETFAGTQFQAIFERIADLRPHERAFSRAVVARVLVVGCHIENLLRFDTIGLQEIRFVNSDIRNVQTGAFDVLKIASIIFDRCRIGVIQSNALSVRVSNEINISTEMRVINYPIRSQTVAK